MGKKDGVASPQNADSGLDNALMKLLVAEDNNTSPSHDPTKQDSNIEEASYDIKQLFQAIVDETHLKCGGLSTGEYYDELERRIKEL